jgi:hypothetical protein
MRQSNCVRALAFSSVLAILFTGVAQAQRYDYTREVSLPRGTVLKAELNDRLSSIDSRTGDRFTGTIRDDGSGLPSGTEVVGQVLGVQRATEKEPGMVDVDFRSLRLPNGRVYPIDGRLTSLDASNIRRTSSGRLEARRSSSTAERNKFLGYGAGAGAIIGALTGGNLLKGALLGAAAGYLFQQLNKDKGNNGRYSEVNLKSGTEFGVELARATSLRLVDDRSNDYRDRSTRYGYDTTYRGSTSYDSRYDRTSPRTTPYDQRTAGAFERYRGDIRVVVDGRELRFNDGTPFMSSGRLLVPIAPVMAAAGYRYDFDPRYRSLSVRGDRGEARLTLGEDFAYIDGDRVRLDTPAQRINGVLYVPVQFLEQATDFRSDWDGTTRTLRLTTGDRVPTLPNDRYR